MVDEVKEEGVIEKEEEGKEEEARKVYDWIDKSVIGVIEKENRSPDGEVAEYVIKHPMGNVITYPRTQMTLTDGKHYLYPYSVSAAIKLAEVMSDSLQKCQELVKLRDMMNIDEETYRENTRRIIDQQKILERYQKTMTNLDLFIKRVDAEIDKMMVQVSEARTASIFGDLSDDEFSKAREIVKQRAQAVRTIKKFVEDLKERMTSDYEKLTELVYAVAKSEERPGEVGPKRRVFHLETSA